MPLPEESFMMKTKLRFPSPTSLNSTRLLASIKLANTFLLDKYFEMLSFVKNSY